MGYKNLVSNFTFFTPVDSFLPATVSHFMLKDDEVKKFVGTMFLDQNFNGE